MRRIRIGEHETLLSEEYKTRMQREQHFDGVLVFPLKRLKSLKKKFDEGLVQEYVGKDEHGHDVYTIPADIDSFGRYVQEIINRYSRDLLTVKPSEMGRVIDAFEAILNNGELTRILKVGRNAKKPFWEIVVSQMMYQEIRRWIFPEYIRRQELKSCVYCNANYTITDVDGIAYYDLDHWKPKSKYPFLCISFFNLQPSCHSCNMHKGDDDHHEYMGLYVDRDEEPQDIFCLTLDDADVANYITEHDRKHLNIKFRSLTPQYEAMCNDMNTQLHIESMYREHQDVAEEVIWRKMIYNDSFKDSLRNLLEEKNFTDEEIDRFISGSYFDEVNVHKRPLTKLMQDVFKSCRI